MINIIVFWTDAKSLAIPLKCEKWHNRKTEQAVSIPSRRCPDNSTYVRDYDENFRYRLLEKNCIEIVPILFFGILEFVISEFLYVIYYGSELWIALSRTAEGLGPQY